MLLNCRFVWSLWKLYQYYVSYHRKAYVFTFRKLLHWVQMFGYYQPKTPVCECRSVTNWLRFSVFIHYFPFQNVLHCVKSSIFGRFWKCVGSCVKSPECSRVTVCNNIAYYYNCLISSLETPLWFQVSQIDWSTVFDRKQVSWTGKE